MATMKVIAQRRAEPRDDLISLWCHTEGREWSDAEVLQETILLLDGGAETTRTVIGAIIRELALRPDQRRQLLDRPELLAGPAVEEFIRWVTPILNMRRTATVDHELHGQQIRAGDEVLLHVRRRPTATSACSSDPTASTSPARRTTTSRSASAPTSASAPSRPARAAGDVRGAAAPHPDWELVGPSRRSSRPPSPAPTIASGSATPLAADDHTRGGHLG